MPRITCPYCGNTIGLEERREIDRELILNALKRGPKRFTELYHATHLSRKTLSLRLKALCNSSTAIKRDGRYWLNGAHSPQTKSKTFRAKEVRRALSVVKRNQRIIALLLLWTVSSVTLAYAFLTKPSEIQTVYQRPVASFTISPSMQPGVGWEVEGSKIISGQTVLTFDASSSYDPDGTINQYTWQFGDGSSATGSSVAHVYPSSGRYAAKLTVVDDSGVDNTEYKEILVYSQPTSEIFLETFEIGENIEVYIIVKNVVDMFGWQAGLRFNPAALECLSFEKGEQKPDINLNTTYIYDEGLFNGSSGGTLWYPPTIKNEKGTTSPAGCTLVGDVSPTSGTGMLAKITFEVLSEEEPYDLQLADVMLVSKDASEIPVIVS